MKLVKDLKKGTDRLMGKERKLLGKVHGAGESTKAKLDDVKDAAVEQIEPLKEIAKVQSSGLKEEVKDLKRIFQSKDLIFYKTDAFAIVLRKLGGLDEFLAACDKLTREGYTLVWSEIVTLPVAIPLGGKMLGSFYYFQKVK